MKLNALFAGFVLALTLLAGFTAADLTSTKMKQNPVLVADGPGPENPPPIIIW
jgi:hypothetical protein